MALPDYSQYPHYRDYVSGYSGPKRDMISQRRFRKHKPPPAPRAAPITSPTVQPQNSAGRDYSQHPFFDPNANYTTRPGTTQSFDPGTSPYNYYATEESPEGYYYGVMNQMGFGGVDARSQAAQGMFKDYARGYQAAKINNHDLWFPEFMNMQDVQGVVRGLSNRQLGIDENLYGGRDRWSLRGY